MGGQATPACLIPHLEGLRKHLGHLPKNIVTDAGYGSEENYAYLEQHGLGNFVKYNTFYQDTHHFRKPEVIRKHQFRAENFAYDPEKDEFICPAEKRLSFQYTSRYTTDNGYLTDRRNYECRPVRPVPSNLNAPKPKAIARSASAFDYSNIADKPELTCAVKMGNTCERSAPWKWRRFLAMSNTIWASEDSICGDRRR